MIQDINDNRHFIADAKNIFKRKSDGIIAGTELWLGYTYYMDGVLLHIPQFEEIEDYEEVLDGGDVVLLNDEDIVLTGNGSEMMSEVKLVAETPTIESTPPKSITVADYRELERKVETLMKLIGGSV